MAAQAWKFYNLAKKKIGNGSISLASTAMRISLVTSASNFATKTLGVFNSLTNEVSETTDYSSSGAPLTGEVWTTSGAASAGQYKWDANDIVWTASSGAINNIKGAVIWLSAASSAGRHLVCFASLTSSQFNLASGNTLTIQFNSNGIATLT